MALTPIQKLLKFADGSTPLGNFGANGSGALWPVAVLTDASGNIVGNQVSLLGQGYAASGLTAVTGAVAENTVTISLAAPGIVTWVSHGLFIGQAVTFETTSALPTGLTAGTTYYVSSQSFTTGHFAVSSTYANAIAGTSITTSVSQAGTQYAVPLQSYPFTPLAGRGFNISVWGTFVGTIQLQRQIQGVWQNITAAGTQLFTWTAPASEQNQEDEFGVPYQLLCTTYTSGTINYSIEQ